MVIPLHSRPFTNSVAPASEQLEALRARLVGELITGEHQQYDTLRQVQEITVDRRPLALVRVADEQDIAAAVRFARDHAYPLAVRSGGHSLARLSMIDGAIIVDLCGMNEVAINPAARTARVQAGATSGDLAGPAHQCGLALSTGDTSTVGMGGLTTGGGIGFMVRKYGLAIDNLLSARVVTADGEIMTASADEHPELFWAIRGGGGNFGIVTEFEYRLAPVSQVLGGELLLPASREVIRGYLEYTASAPDDLTTLANLMHAPPAPHVPSDRVGELVLSILVCWTGSIEAGERALAPLRALARPIADLVSPIPYPRIYSFTAHQEIRHGWSIRSMFADELSDTTLDAALSAMERANSPYSIIQFRGLGGAMRRVSSEATAFAHRDRRYFVALVGVWLDPGEDPAVHKAWVRSLWEQVRHECLGVYVNFLEEDEGKARILDAYPSATFARLAEIKRRYDPWNFFKFNQNIRPRS
jgi:FAD/FMN-containing dehydrogenase